MPDFTALSPSAAFEHHNKLCEYTCSDCGAKFMSRGKRAKRCPDCKVDHKCVSLTRFEEPSRKYRQVERWHHQVYMPQGPADDPQRAAFIDAVCARRRA